MTTNGNGQGWVRYWPVVVTILGLGAGIVTLHERVRRLDKDMGTKANQETVDAKLDAILRELQTVNRRLDRIAR